MVYLPALVGFIDRWMYLRFAALPQIMLLEPITEHIFLGPLASLSFLYMFSIPIYVFLPLHYLCACILDYALAAIVEVSEYFISKHL